MTKKIFWQNPYLTELNTTITFIKENQITLAETIFFAFSGGQESDQGLINGQPVLKAEKIGLEIFYTLESVHGLDLGDRVTMQIDWPRRYRLMRLHFAAELVLELMLRRFPTIQKIGAHIASDKARIDFATDRNIATVLPEIQQAAQDIITADREIICAFSDEINERRYWQIAGFSRVPCGGTHVKRTGEIGTITLKRVNPGKGKERVEIYVT
jgi:alanyl-tRNA synthetase